MTGYFKTSAPRKYAKEGLNLDLVPRLQGLFIYIEEKNIINEII